MYKITDTISKEVWIGTEKAVINFANNRLQNKDIKWVTNWFKDLVEIGFVFVKVGNFWRPDKITNIELATKFFQRVENVEIVDIGDVIEELKKDELILLS